jgi:hypothetical protein
MFIKLFFCLGLLCFCFSSFSQQYDPIKIRNQEDSLRLKDLAQQKEAPQKLKARRDSMVIRVSADLKVPKAKVEDALTAISAAVADLQKVSDNDELTSDQKLQQLKVIAERKEATLKNLLNADQLEKLNSYINRRQIPKKIE